MNIYDEEQRKNLLQILPYYKTFIESPKIKKLSNNKLLQELPFYNECSIVKNKCF